jgi:hypothetical protein
LIGNFAQSETKMIKYIDANATRCGIPPQAADQLRAGHNNTEAMQKKVCAVARSRTLGATEPVGDFPQSLGATGPVGDFPQLDR